MSNSAFGITRTLARSLRRRIPLIGLNDQYLPQAKHLSTAAVVEPLSPRQIKIPPNLIIDPTSSFAMPSAQADNDVEYDDEETEHDPKLDAPEDKDGRFIVTPSRMYAIPLPDRLNVEVHTLFSSDGSTLTGSLILEESVFGKDPIRVDLLKRAVNYYRNKKRGRRKAKTKTLSEVSGSRRKVRQQKGSGMARAGHSRPAHWRGGYKAHGPKNITDYGKTKLNKKVRRLALRHVLSQKLKEGNLLVLDRLYDLPTYKTNDLAKLLNPWDIAGSNLYSALCIDHYVPEKEDQPESLAELPLNLIVASRNLSHWSLGNTHAANVYEILRHDKLIMTLSAIQQLESRLKE